MGIRIRILSDRIIGEQSIGGKGSVVMKKGSKKLKQRSYVLLKEEIKFKNI